MRDAVVADCVLHYRYTNLFNVVEKRVDWHASTIDLLVSPRSFPFHLHIWFSSRDFFFVVVWFGARQWSQGVRSNVWELRSIRHYDNRQRLRIGWCVAYSQLCVIYIGLFSLSFCYKQLPVFSYTSFWISWWIGMSRYMSFGKVGVVLCWSSWLHRFHVWLFVYKFISILVCYLLNIVHLHWKIFWFWIL